MTTTTPTDPAELQGPDDVTNPVDLPEDAARADEKKLPEGHGLKKRAINASYWATGSYFAAQGLRFGSNLIMARLLVPEDFGIMALVNIIVVGLQMFSDMGIGPALIQNKREDEVFQNTAYSMQVVRGFALWIVACALAYPLSIIRPDWSPLLYLLPVAAFTTVFGGFKNTGWFTANRRLDIKKVSIVELNNSIIGITVMICFAIFISASAWALVAGVLVSSLALTIQTHRIDDTKNRFQFDREAFTQLYHFGKWIFVSTVITFGAAQFDKFVIAGLLSPAMLGIYWIGLQLAILGPEIFKRFGKMVGFAALSDLYRRDQDRFYMRQRQLRYYTVTPTIGVLLFMILIGPIFFAILYPGPYIEAGWIVQIVAFNSTAGIISGSYGVAFMARGDTFANMLTVLFQLLCTVLGTLGGYYIGQKYYGDPNGGLLLGLSVVLWIKYPFDVLLAKRNHVYTFAYDVTMLVVSAGLAYVALLGSRVLAEWLVL